MCPNPLSLEGPDHCDRGGHRSRGRTYYPRRAVLGCTQRGTQGVSTGFRWETEDADREDWNVPITGSNPFRWRHYPGDVIMCCVRWYLSYRAVDSNGQTIDFLLTAKRDAAAAKRFFRRALSNPGNRMPRVINVDKNRA